MKTVANSANSRPGSGPVDGVGQPQEFDDGRSFDPVAVQKSTQLWIEQRMKSRESQFTESAPVKIFCGSWNVNGKYLKEGALSDWLCPANTEYSDSNGCPTSDLYFIGFQEAVDLTAVNVAMDTETRKRTGQWQEAISECLSSKGGRYKLLATKYLVGLILYAYVKESLVGFVRDVRTSSAAVGIGGFLGNKGGVSIRLTLFDSAICAICSHLAAHRENVAGRNADFQNIIEKSIFSVQDSATDAVDSASAQGSAGMTSPDRKVDPMRRSLRYKTGLSETEDVNILDHDIVMWLGDLNYRIDESIPLEDVFQRIQSGDYQSLRDTDQLNIERARGNVFQEFNEGVLNFAPTYKYQPGTDEYDRRPEKKIRCPAWCDRVLWRVGKERSETVTQLTYQRAELRPSDHKPISSLFGCSLRKVISDRERAVFEELLRELDKWENDSIPRIEVSNLKINLGLMHYAEKYATSITLTNSGTSIGHWRLVPKADQRISKRFIKFFPTYGMLLPGEQIELKLEAEVDVITARLLNRGMENLEDNIVLRVENGPDFYISVDAQYARSCYGMSLEELVCTWDPVRFTTALTDDSHIPSSDDAVAAAAASQAASQGLLPAGQIREMSIPKELWRLVDALYVGGGMTERDIFQLVADPIEVATVRECLDRGEEFPPQVSPHALAEALGSFITALPSPLIPTDSTPSPSDVDQQHVRPWAKKFLEQLPPLNYNVFVYLMSFERELLKNETDNRLTVSKLASFSVQIMTRLSGTSLAVSKDGDASPAGAGASGTVGKGGAAAGADLDVGEPKITTPQGAAQALISYFLTAQTL